jgi:hypothetical protein
MADNVIKIEGHPGNKENEDKETRRAFARKTGKKLLQEALTPDD